MVFATELRHKNGAQYLVIGNHKADNTTILVALAVAKDHGYILEVYEWSDVTDELSLSDWSMVGDWVEELDKNMDDASGSPERHVEELVRALMDEKVGKAFKLVDGSYVLAKIRHVDISWEDVACTPPSTPGGYEDEDSVPADPPAAAAAKATKTAATTTQTNPGYKKRSTTEARYISAFWNPVTIKTPSEETLSGIAKMIQVEGNFKNRPSTKLVASMIKTRFIFGGTFEPFLDPHWSDFINAEPNALPPQSTVKLTGKELFALQPGEVFVPHVETVEEKIEIFGKEFYYGHLERRAKWTDWLEALGELSADAKKKK